jgi:hypothetical protein
MAWCKQGIMIVLQKLHLVLVVQQLIIKVMRFVAMPKGLCERLTGGSFDFFLNLSLYHN